MGKRLNEEQRADLVRYANRLIQGGVSRRRMNTVLRAYSLEKFGVESGIGAATHSKLFRKKMEAVKRRERGYRGEEKVKFVSDRTRRKRNFNKLIDAHFLPWEAEELTTKLLTLRYYEIGRMKAQRAKLFRQFLRIADIEGYARHEIPAQWGEFVWSWWYMRTVDKWQRQWERSMVKRGARLRTRPDREVLLWRWFAHVKKKPPAVNEYTRRRRTKRKRVTKDDIRKQQINARKAQRNAEKAERIANLQAQIERTRNPKTKVWLQGLIEREKTR